MTTRTRRRKPDIDLVRIELLEAGRALLADGTRSERLPVKLTAACRLTGHTSRLAATIWPDQQLYEGDLARYVASSFEWAGPAGVQDEMVEIVTTCTEFSEAIQRAAPLYFRHLLANENFYLALQFWSVPEPTAELTEALARGYDVVHTAFKDMFEGVMLLYGRRLRAPYTLDQLTASLTSITEGLALRHRIQPEVVDAPVTTPAGDLSSLFAEATLAVAERYTETVGDVAAATGS